MSLSLIQSALKHPLLLTQGSFVLNFLIECVNSELGFRKHCSHLRVALSDLCFIALYFEKIFYSLVVEKLTRRLIVVSLYTIVSFIVIIRSHCVVSGSMTSYVLALHLKMLTSQQKCLNCSFFICVLLASPAHLNP